MKGGCHELRTAPCCRSWRLAGDVGGLGREGGSVCACGVRVLRQVGISTGTGTLYLRWLGQAGTARACAEWVGGLCLVQAQQARHLQSPITLACSLQPSHLRCLKTAASPPVTLTHSSWPPLLHCRLPGAGDCNLAVSRAAVCGGLWQLWHQSGRCTAVPHFLQERQHDLCCLFWARRLCVHILQHWPVSAGCQLGVV